MRSQYLLIALATLHLGVAGCIEQAPLLNAPPHRTTPVNDTTEAAPSPSPSTATSSTATTVNSVPAAPSPPSNATDLRRGFDLRPFVGALPIRFGMSKQDVQAILGAPERSQARFQDKGIREFRFKAGVVIGYDVAGGVEDVEFMSECPELSVLGEAYRTPEMRDDPNRLLIRHDPDPVETNGILVFLKLGISTGGYHDNSENESSRTITISRAGTWDYIAARGLAKPDLSKYRSQE